MLVCISSPRCFFCSSWWCVHTQGDEEVTSGHRSLLTKLHCDSSTNFHIKPFSFTILYVDSDIAGQMAGENSTQQFSWHWPADDESILPIVTSIVDTTILSIVNAAIASLQDHRWKIPELWGCRGDPNRDGVPYACNVTRIFDNNTAAGWVNAVMKFCNPTLFCVVYCSQQADGTAGAQLSIHGSCSCLPLDDILPPPAEDMIEGIREHLYDNDEMRYPNPTCFPTTKTGFLSLNGKIKTALSDSSNTLKSSETVLLFFLPITSKALYWRGCGFVMRQQSHCESFPCWLFGQ